MADEVETKETPQEPATVTEVTDDALSSAWDASEQTQTPETPTEPQGEQEQVEGEQQEPQAEEPTDNAERSRLGRRLKATEDKLDAILARLQPAEPQPERPAAIPENVTYDDTFIQGKIDEAVQAGTLPETIMTPHDQYKVNQFVTQLQHQIGNEYAVRYLNNLKSPVLKGDTPDDVHVEVLAELQRVESPFNLRRYDNPTVDARMNYLEAKNAVLTKRLVSGKPPNVFKGKKGELPTGTSVTTRMDTVADDIPVLYELSQDFIKRTGMSVDSVKAALKGATPLNLRGGGFR